MKKINKAIEQIETEIQTSMDMIATIRQGLPSGIISNACFMRDDINKILIEVKILIKVIKLLEGVK